MFFNSTECLSFGCILQRLIAVLITHVTSVVSVKMEGQSAHVRQDCRVIYALKVCTENEK